jgi:hypothetical protein
MAIIQHSKLGAFGCRRITFFLLTADSVIARNNDILKRLVLEAKREYEKDAEHRVHIFMADT